MAEDRADQFKRDRAPVVAEIEQRLHTDLRTMGDFQRLHPVPQSTADVPDDMDARLVVLGPEHPHSSGPNSKAQAEATAMLERRGNTPRLFRNTLIFLAVDQTRLQDLEEAARRYLAWSSILQEKEALNLDPHQVRQAEAQLKSEDGAVVGRLPEAYQWLLVPVQSTPQAAVEWQALRLAGQDPLAVRVSKKLRSEELLVPVLAGTRLRLELDRVPLWRGDHVEIRLLADHFARYLYLPRLAGPEVLIAAIQDGLALLLWTDESFAFADAFDEATGRYRGLRCGRAVELISPTSDGLLVKPEVALAQQNAEPAAAATGASSGVAETGVSASASDGTSPEPTPASPEQKARRFHGAVTLDATRVGRDASQIADEVIAHLAGLVGAKVTVTLEIEAEIPRVRPTTSCAPSPRTAGRSSSSAKVLKENSPRVKLEDLQPNAAVRGILADGLAVVVSVQWFGSEALELTYKTPAGKVANELLYRTDEARIEVVEQGRPWSFDGDGALFRLVSEALRIRLAHLFDPVLAVHTSVVEPLPHQITAVYESMLPRQPLRFLLADDPGAGKTIMAGLLIKELIARGDLERCLIVCPGSLAEQWQDELYRRFELPFEIMTNDKLEAARTGNWFLEADLVIARLDKLARDEQVQQKLQAPDAGWDLVVCDEAHKMSASFLGGEIRYTKRYRLGQLLSGLTRHFLLMTATPHNGKEEDFQLFMALLDSDRFEGRFRDGVHRADVSDLMRRMVKERLLKFDGKPLFPKRIAYTVPYQISEAEAQLYEAVTGYVREEFNRADALANAKRAGTVGFALTILQRRLASSPEAIYQSLRDGASV